MALIPHVRENGAMPQFIRRASRQAAALVLPVLMAMLFVTAARAADTVITFDDIAANTFLTTALS
jgi:hypothetical protein